MAEKQLFLYHFCFSGRKSSSHGRPYLPNSTREGEWVKKEAESGLAGEGRERGGSKGRRGNGRRDQVEGREAEMVREGERAAGGGRVRKGSE